jgi:hypothetical protein
VSAASRLVSWLTATVIVTGAVTALLAPSGVDQLPRGFESPVMALQLAHTVDEAAMIVDGPERRAQFFRATLADAPFVAASTALWSLMAWQVTPWLVAPAVIAGVADLVEDAATIATLGAPARAGVDWMRRAARTKWCMLGITFVGLGFGALRRAPRDGWDFVCFGIDLAYLYAGILCLVGAGTSGPVVERSILPLAAAVVTQLAVTVLRPRG